MLQLFHQSSIVSIMPPNNWGETCHSCDSSSKQGSSADSFWSNTSDRRAESICSQRKTEEDERKEAKEDEQPRYVKSNPITPICHGYTWTHTAADLFVQMMQRQNQGEIFFLAWKGWKKAFVPKRAEETNSYTRCKIKIPYGFCFCTPKWTVCHFISL